MRRGRGSAGFGLVEMMVVVAIIGIVMVAIAPSITVVLAEARMRGAMQEVMRLGRRARWKALVSGTPHAVHLEGAAPAFGRARLFKGMGTRCDHTDWNQASGQLTGTSLTFDFASVNTTANDADDDGMNITLRSQLAGVNVASIYICHQPNGESFVGVPVAGAVTMQRQRTDVTARISVLQEDDNDRFGDAVRQDVRQIVFSPGQMPWYAPWLSN